MKVVKILGVVFGALLLLTGIGLLAGSAAVGAGQNEFDEQLAQQGLAGPVEGRVTNVEDVAGAGPLYTVSYTDKQGNAQNGTGPTGDDTDAPAVGDEVELYYSIVDASQIIILDFPGGDFAGISGALRTAGIICLVAGAILLLAGIVGLVVGRQQAAAPAGPPAYAGASGQVPPDRDPSPQGGQPGPEIDPNPTQPFPEGQAPIAPPESNRPG